jgi:AcrR family transcriptional regulator
MAATASQLTTLSRRLTAQRGLNGFTIEELCDEVGISRRTFFNYFPSKEEAVIGVDETQEAERYSEAFLVRGSRGWPAVVDDLVELAVDHVRAAEFGLAEHADFIAAVGREPRLLARIMDISRDREQQLTELVARRERTTTGDLRAAAAVQVVGTVLRSAGARILDPDDDRDLATAITDSLAAIRAVTATPSPTTKEHA